MGIVESLRTLFSYFGIEIDDNFRLRFERRTGSYRSLVRYIASYLPLSSIQRPFIHIPRPLHPQIDEEVSIVYANGFTADDCRDIEVEETDDDSASIVSDALLSLSRFSPTPSTMTENPESLAKISALEEELVRLREQIAGIIIQNRDTEEELSVSGTMGAPPPPPPPPPPIQTPTPLVPLSEIIRKNKENKVEREEERDRVPGLPNMAQVLKGLDKVKLRSVARSPGGTPLRQKPRESEALDPASLIAAALKKKFAHRFKHQDSSSPDKENSLTSPFASPTIPPFGPHLLKPAAQRKSFGDNVSSSSPSNVLKTVN
ncbi:mitochondrial fission regulator 2-like [Oscarella lobularis]|uniref:mitochondrial fission regulator 2-like n=1 Tax=Oscarella lobularis TaxID=121494 RepID=UPI0033134F50